MQPLSVKISSRATVVVTAFLSAHLLLAHWYGGSWWGIDLLAFYPLWVQGVFALLSVLLFLSPVRQLILNGLRQVDLWESSRRGLLLQTGFVLGGVLVFAGLHSVVPLLGDGQQYLREFPLNISRWGSEPLTFWLLEGLFGIANRFGISPETIYRAYSYVSGGLYLLLSLATARALGPDRRERWFLLGFLVTPGFMQLFCGYVENYALLLPGVLGYLLCSLQVLRGRAPVWSALAVLGVLVPLHFATLALTPSLVALVVLRGRMVHGFPGVWWSLLGALGLPLVLALGFSLALGVDPLALLREAIGRHLLPLWGPPGFTQAYPLWAGGHWLDVLNQHVLVVPAALMGLLLIAGRGGGFLRQPEGLFMGCAAGFSLLFVFLVNPEIGFFRDWDLLAFASLPLTLGTALWLTIHYREVPGRLGHTGLLLCGAAALHTLLWLGVNAWETSAVMRFTRLLQTSPLSRHARSYGWETLGVYWREEGRIDKSLEAYLAAIEANPENPRHWAGVGYQHLSLGQVSEAVQAFEKSLQINPDQPILWNRLGVIYAETGEYGKSVAALKKAVGVKELGLNQAMAWYTLGNSLTHLGQYQEAVAAYQQALQLEPDRAETYFNLGFARSSLEDGARAEEAYRRALELEPMMVKAYNQLGNLYSDKGEYDRAIVVYKKAVEIDSTNAIAHFNLAMLYHRLGRKDLFQYFGKQFLQYWRGDKQYRLQIERLLAE